MLSKPYIRNLSILGISLASVLLLAANSGRLLLQAQALEPNRSNSEMIQGASSPVVETPADLPTTDLPEPSKAQQSESEQEESFKAGKALLENRCSSCHTAPRATTHTMAEWPECLNRMAPRSFLRDSEVKQILFYLKQELKSVENDENQLDG